MKDKLLAGVLGVGIWALTLTGMFFTFATGSFYAWAAGATWYLATTGSNTTCANAQVIGTPAATMNFILACSALAPGDTIYIRAGTYNQRMDISPSGKNGSAVAQITVSGYPGDAKPLWQYTDSVLNDYGGIRAWGSSYWSFINLIVDGTNYLSSPPNVNTATGWHLNNNHHFVLDGVEIRNQAYNGLLIENNSHDITIRNSYIHDACGACYGDNANFRWYGIYIHDSVNVTVEKTIITGNPGGGIHAWPGPHTDLTIRGNHISANDTFQSSNVGGLLVGGTNTRTQIYDNLIDGNGIAPSTTGPGFYIFGTAPSGILFLNNTVYGNQTQGILIESAAPSNILQNNLVVGNGGLQIDDHGSGTIQTTNRTTGVITDCTLSTSDFRQKAGSACLNAGTIRAGFPYNDTAPDIGALEKLTFASCAVESGDASTLRITINNAAFPPLLPATGITGFTVRKAGSNDVVTAAIRTGTNRVDLTLTNAIAGGDAVDFSTSGAGNLTDSALIANSINQPYNAILVNQACTNNVAGGASYVFTQTVFRFNGLRGTEAAPVATPYAAAPENTNVFVIPAGSVRVRIGLSGTIADPPPTGFIPRFKRNGGAATVVPDIFAADNIAMCGTSPDPNIPGTNSATTQQLSGSGTFAPGAFLRTSAAVPNIDMALGGRTEIEACLSFHSAATTGDTYDILMYRQDGTALTYNVTPRITIISAQGGSGF